MQPSVFLIAACLIFGPGCGSLLEISSPEFSAASLPFDFAAVPLDEETAALSPVPIDPAVVHAVSQFRQSPTSGRALGLAETCYALAKRDEAAQKSRCTDYYYMAATFAWPAMFPGLGLANAVGPQTEIPPLNDPAAYSTGEDPLLIDAQAGQLYNSAVGRCLACAQRYGRLDARGRLLINTPQTLLAVPTTHHGFAWRSVDFDWIAEVSEYQSEELSRQHRRGGLGAALVVFRQNRPEEPPAIDEAFFREMQPFAATGLLKPQVEELVESMAEDVTTARPVTPSQASVEFHDPLRKETADVNGYPAELAADLTAPLAAVVENPERRKLELLGFLRPGNTLRSSRLYMVEPYQPGKIPLVFVHGLLSSPLTWGDMVNELRADPLVRQYYQIWLYRYPTGAPFLKSAAEFRAALRMALETIDPHGEDEALNQMVLAGHSMGGLLSKLQVATSGETLWRLFANKPLAQLTLDAPTHAALDSVFFFDPQPFVKRVIFIGTPHRGSRFATNFIGKIGTRLVEVAPEQMASLEKASQENPGAFRDVSRQAIPSSVDLLAPQSPLLTAMLHLPVSPEVHTHSIIGKLNGIPFLGDGDGVVPLSSAKIPSNESEIIVSAHHSFVHRHPDTIKEVLRILELHAWETVEVRAKTAPRKR